jgi:hypothetical protein
MKPHNCLQLIKGKKKLLENLSEKAKVVAIAGFLVK